MMIVSALAKMRDKFWRQQTAAPAEALEAVKEARLLLMRLASRLCIGERYFDGVSKAYLKTESSE